MQNEQDNSQASPLVTFIIAYYNLPTEMLRQCLDSILALTLCRNDRQIIVVDDGSDQSPLEELSQYMDDILYLRQPNAGLSEARNSGIQMAKGQYLQFVDADDLLLQSPYEHCLDIVRFKQPDIVMFDFTDGNDNDNCATFNTEDLRSGTEYLSQHNLQATACGYLFKRSMIGNLRFTPGIYHEDEEFTPQLLLRAESVLATDAKAYFYRHRPHSITTEEDKRKVVKRISDKLLVIKKLHRMADTMPTEERLALNRRVAQLTMDYIYNIITQTRDRQFLDHKLEQLRLEGLFPLPDRDYTTKYKWFRRMTNSSIGLSLLMNVLPMINKER
jgi:glycosyltransferase involved in cell wall biosynthesis